MVSDHVPGAVCAGLPVGPIQSGRLVSTESSQGSIRSPATHSRSAHARPRFGSLRIWVLLRREGWLMIRMRVRRRKHIALHRGPAPTPTERWSMDFVHDTLADGRPFRILTVVDHRSRHSPVLEVGVRISGGTVGQALDRVLGEKPGPRSITVESRDGIPVTSA